MKCDKCGYDDNGSGDIAHACTFYQSLSHPVAEPKRPWVGLTDEDVRQCSRDVAAGGKENCVDRFAYAIEAKLKEKNT